MKYLHSFCSNLNYKNKLKVKSFKLKRNYFLVQLSNLLIQQGLISHIVSSIYFLYFRVFLYYSAFSNRTFSNVLTLSGVNRRISVRFNQITFLRKKFPYCHLIFSTSSGILSDFGCLLKKTGGIFIFSIF